MHEQTKLDEARYFLTRIERLLPEPDAFRYNLSAFLSAARSVCQYARKEATAKPGGQMWYDLFAGSHPLIKFFASERDTNIHERPVQPNSHVDVYATDALHLSETATVEKFDVDGNLVEMASFPPPKVSDPPPPDFKVQFVYRFATWPGSEDALELCSAYLRELAALVQDGQRSKFLS